MTPGCLRCFSRIAFGRGLVALSDMLSSMLLVALLGLLSGCATLAPPPSPTPWLHDALFDHPPRPAEADGVMALDASMHRYLDGVLAGAVHHKGRARALAEALYARGELQLDYDSSVTRNAAQAFAARSGNCLSLVLMTAALARELGLAVSYQSATAGEYYSRQGNLTLQAGHVNLVLAPRLSRWYQNGIHYMQEGDAMRIDFLPPEALRGQRSVPISEQRVLAMFMNNRAVEALQRQPLAQAYAWAREALRLDPGFLAAYNTLGVVYQRAGHPVPAAAAFEQVLAQDPRHLPAMVNLAPVLRTLGRHDEADRWTALRQALRPHAPFHFLGLAEGALARGDLAQARDLLDREEAVTGDTHELYFQRAQLHLAMGREGPAEAALQRAMDTSETQRQRQAYAGKLARLRALAAH